MKYKTRHLLPCIIVGVSFLAVFGQTPSPTQPPAARAAATPSPSSSQPTTAGATVLRTQSPAPTAMPTGSPMSPDGYVKSLAVGWFSITDFPVWYIWIFLGFAVMVALGQFYLRIKRQPERASGVSKWLVWTAGALLAVFFLIIGFWIGGWRANSELLRLVHEGKLLTPQQSPPPIQPTPMPAPIVQEGPSKSEPVVSSYFFWVLLLLAFVLFAGLELMIYQYLLTHRYWLRDYYGYYPWAQKGFHNFRDELSEELDYLRREVSYFKRSLNRDA